MLASESGGERNSGAGIGPTGAGSFAADGPRSALREQCRRPFRKRWFANVKFKNSTLAK